MSRIPRDLARRVDGLAWRAHLFHRWAHHPLCAEYEREVVRVGRKMRLCRGCLAAGAGAVSGMVVGLLGKVPPLGLMILVFACAVGLLVGFSRRPAGSRAHPKWLTRFLPLFLTALAAISGLRTLTWLGAALATLVLALLSAALVRYRRRGPGREPCAGCAERTQPETCRGMREILSRERAFARLASRLYSVPDR